MKEIHSHTKTIQRSNQAGNPIFRIILKSRYNMLMQSVFYPMFTKFILKPIHDLPHFQRTHSTSMNDIKKLLLGCSVVHV